MNLSTIIENEMDSDIDPVQEFQLRIWARTNYTPADQRDENWHPIILDEMSRKDAELQQN